jgi:hypothetical protein
VITVDDVRRIAHPLPRSAEHLIRDRVKFRVGGIVYAAFSRDESTMGFGYPRDERDALIASAPDTFFLPRPSELRFQWVQAWTAELDPAELPELIVEAWRMCVPKKISALVPGPA